MDKTVDQAVRVVEPGAGVRDEELEGKHVPVRCRFCRTPNALPAPVVVQAMRQFGDPDPAKALANVHAAAARGEGPVFKCFQCGKSNPVLKSEVVPSSGQGANRRQRRANAAAKRRK